MPLLQYFGVIGSLLLALLFVADAWFPKAPPRSEPMQYSIRVAAERKAPERLTFSGPTVDYGVAPSLAILQPTHERQDTSVVASTDGAKHAMAERSSEAPRAATPGRAVKRKAYATRARNNRDWRMPAPEPRWAWTPLRGFDLN